MYVCLLREEAAHKPNPPSHLSWLVSILVQGYAGDNQCPSSAAHHTQLVAHCRAPSPASPSLPSSPLSPITPVTHGNLPAHPRSAVMRHVRDPGALSLEEVGALVQQAMHIAAGEWQGAGGGGEMDGMGVDGMVG